MFVGVVLLHYQHPTKEMQLLALDSKCLSVHASTVNDKKGKALPQNESVHYSIRGIV